jgi:hypothetical protein
MATITSLVDKFTDEERPVGNLLDAPVVLAQAIAAVKFYSGYTDLETHAAIPIADPAPDVRAPFPEITGATDISVSEWAMIRPLFLLYVERENALQLEASRGMGIDVFGRSSSEIAGDITQMEIEYPHRAFFLEITTI